MAGGPRVIPTVAGVPFYTIRTRLDGREYGMRFAWNQRAERWILDVRSDIDEPLAMGIRLVSNWPLLRFYQSDLRLPPGELVVTDHSLDGSPPGMNDLVIGGRCELIYFARTDL